MANPIERAAATMRGAQEKIDGRTVRIENRSGQFADNVVAVVGDTRTNTVLENDMLVETRMRNYLIRVADYDFGAGPVEPSKGDLIIEDGTTFMVTEDFTDSTWRWSDRSRLWYRINVVEKRRP